MVGGEGTNLDIVTRFYLEYDGVAPTSSQCADYALSIGADWSTAMAGLTDSAYNLNQVEVIDLTSPTSGAGSDFTVRPGVRAGTALSLQECVVISYRIGRRYRGGHPRGYWRMGVVADRASSQEWSTDFVTNVSTTYNAFIAAVAGDAWAGAGTIGQVNVSYYQGFTVITSPTTGRARNVPTLRAHPVVDVVTAGQAQPFIGTQRRRIQFQD
jgi:hypothetical protein